MKSGYSKRLVTLTLITLSGFLCAHHLMHQNIKVIISIHFSNSYLFVVKIVFFPKRPSFLSRSRDSMSCPPLYDYLDFQLRTKPFSGLNQETTLKFQCLLCPSRSLEKTFISCSMSSVSNLKKHVRRIHGPERSKKIGRFITEQHILLLYKTI